MPHHVTQRGNRRQQTFFSEDDYGIYKELLTEYASKFGVGIWAWCLMPNHVHLILVPATTDGLTECLREVHRRYTRHINFRENWRGYLWQGRFASCVMSEPHLLAAARYVERNPVRAKLCRTPRQWRWSSASAHLTNKADGLTDRAALLDLVPNWKAFLKRDLAEHEAEALRYGERTGRPLGDDTFLETLERSLGRPVRRQKPGPHRN